MMKRVIASVVVGVIAGFGMVAEALVRMTLTNTT